MSDPATRNSLRRQATAHDRRTSQALATENIRDDGKVLARARPSDARPLLQGRLDPARTRELTERMLVAGLPV